MSVQSPSTAVPPADRLRARRGVVLFLILVVAFDVVLTTVTVLTGNAIWILVLMWSVAVASLICRLVLREGIRDVSFRLGGRRTLAYLAAAVLFPLMVGFIAYGIAWITGLATFTPTAQGLPLLLLFVATVGTVLGIITAAGEEIGWRGYLLTRLIDAGVPRPVLASGVIWGVWHVPLIVAGVYIADSGQSRLLTVLLFMVTVISIGVIIARFRLATGSVWPAIVLHAAWNSIIQQGFDRSTTGANAALWTGEAGILVATVMIIAAVVVSLRPGPVLRSPGDPIVAEKP